MRISLTAIVIVALLSGCHSRPPHVALHREPVTLDSLALEVRNDARRFFLSDKAGGFLTGRTSRDIAGGTWSVNGAEVFQGITLEGNGIDGRTRADRTTVYPTRIVSTLSDGSELQTSLVSVMTGSIPAHALRIDIRPTGNNRIDITPRLGSGWKKTSETAAGSRRWENRSNGQVVQELRSGWEEASHRSDPSSAGDSSTVFLLTTSKNVRLDRTVFRAVDEALQARDKSLLAKLNALYIRTGDARLNRATWWTKATLDGLVIEQPGVSIVSSLPWNGTYSGREIARSFAGLSLTEPDPGVVGAVIRWLANTQQKNASRRSYGRIASTFSSQSRDYDGADVTPDFARFAYDYISVSQDTAMIRELYQLLDQSIAGTMKYHADSLGFLVHWDYETWMDGSDTGSARGNRAVEIQSSWYYEQLVGSFVAEWMKDSSAQRRWAQGAARTKFHFNRLFVDSVNNVLFDHITPEGERVSANRPNALYCLDLLHSEDLQQSIIRRTMEHNIYHRGVGTLSPDDPRFTPALPSSPGGNAFNGPIWTWLSAQAVYSLTRYDRQDLAYILTSHLVEHILDVGMVGGLPSTMSVGAVPAGGSDEGPGQCSVDAEAEFIRGIYQDYLGLTVDATSNEISIHPKLLGELFPVDCNVLVGEHAVRVTYQMRDDVLQVALDGSHLGRPVKIAFLFTLQDGVAWQGMTVLVPGTTLKLDFDSQDVFSYRGDEQFRLEQLQRLSGFSQRNVFTGLHFADEKLKAGSLTAGQ
jgi:Amylo-alpha-1,6-glucosidase